MRGAPADRRVAGRLVDLARARGGAERAVRLVHEAQRRLRRGRRRHCGCAAPVKISGIAAAARVHQHQGRRRGRHGPARVARHHRGRAFGGARVVLLREGQDPDRRRPGAVAHHALGDRAVAAAGRQPDAGIPGFARAVRGAAGRYAGAAVTRPAVPQPACALEAAARPSSGAARRHGVVRDRADDGVRDRAGGVSARPAREPAAGVRRGAGAPQHARRDGQADARRRRERRDYVCAQL